MPRLGSAPLQSYLRFFIFAVPKNRSTLRGGGASGGGVVGWVTVSLRGLRYSEKACNFPQFRREFAHTSPTRTRQPPIGARRPRKFAFPARLGGQLIIELILFHEKRDAFLISVSLSLSLSLSLELYISLSLLNGNRNSQISLQRAHADPGRWYHCDRGPQHRGGLYGFPGSVRHRCKAIYDFSFFGSQKSALLFVGGPRHPPHFCQCDS